MRLLPRTKLGTWLLAGAVWAAPVAAVWIILPIVPRVEWAIADECTIHEVLSAGPTVVTRPVDRGAMPFGRPAGPIRFFDVGSGQTRTICGPDNKLPVIAFSPDGTWLVANFAGRMELHRADDRVVTELRWSNILGGEWSFIPTFSPDGRWMAYPDVDEDGRKRVVRLFDLSVLKQVAVLADADHAVAFSADGQVVAYRTDYREWVVADCPSMVERFRTPATPRDYAHLCTTGDRLVRFDDDGPRQKVSVWDWATGKRLCEQPKGLYAAAPGDARHLFTIDQPRASSEWVVSVWNTDGGALVHQLGLGSGTFLNWRGWVAPNGYAVVYANLGWPAAVRGWLSRNAPWLSVSPAGNRPTLVDVASGTMTAHLAGYAALAPDGESVAVLEDGFLRVYDVPPRRSVPWLLCAAVLLAALAAWWARRRVRRLAAAA